MYVCIRNWLFRFVHTKYFVYSRTRWNDKRCVLSVQIRTLYDNHLCLVKWSYFNRLIYRLKTNRLKLFNRQVIELLFIEFCFDVKRWSIRRLYSTFYLYTMLLGESRNVFTRRCRWHLCTIHFYMMLMTVNFLRHIYLNCDLFLSCLKRMTWVHEVLQFLWSPLSITHCAVLSACRLSELTL